MQTVSPRGDACQHEQHLREQPHNKHSFLSCHPLFSRILKSNRLCGDIYLHNVLVFHGDQATCTLVFLMGTILKPFTHSFYSNTQK